MVETLQNNEANDSEQEAEQDSDVLGILYGLDLIRLGTGYGTLSIEIRNQLIVEMRVEHKIKPHDYKVKV